MAACSGFTIKGKPATTPAMTSPLNSNIIEMLSFAKKLPIIPFFPSSKSRKNPTAIGGKIRGKVTMASTIHLPLHRFESRYANGVPMIRRKIEQVKIVFKLSKNGGAISPQLKAIFINHIFLKSL
jgi:hypothetical protein